MRSLRGLCVEGGKENSHGLVLFLRESRILRDDRADHPMTRRSFTLVPSGGGGFVLFETSWGFVLVSFVCSSFE